MCCSEFGLGCTCEKCNATLADLAGVSVDEVVPELKPADITLRQENLAMLLECYFCGCKVRTVEEAVELGWVPTFYEPGETDPVDCPTCPDCAAKHLEQDDDGEMVRVTE